MRPDTRVRRFRLHRGRAHVPDPPPDPPCPLDTAEIGWLATWKEEKYRGLVHELAWDERMERLQARWSAWREDCTSAYNRWTIENTPGLTDEQRQEYVRQLNG